jgi:hypothetical protein
MGQGAEARRTYLSVADEKMLRAVQSFLDRQKLDDSFADEQYCTKLTVKHRGQTVPVSVYNSGKIVVGGANSELKRLLEEMKKALLEDATLRKLPLFCFVAAQNSSRWISAFIGASCAMHGTAWCAWMSASTQPQRLSAPCCITGNLTLKLGAWQQPSVSPNSTCRVASPYGGRSPF